ncbi:forkhead box protein E3 isoform X1 [Bos taurus]|uniref:forkhead box protein E3 isoform X1 n=1 Tax=Bos taurus TaxID=9913 RepID=UPI0028CB77E2|nr:forkhead box protein E3-like isoform X1 [Bos taurus]
MAVAAARPALPPQEPLQRPEPAGRRPCAEESAGRGAAPPPRLQPPRRRRRRRKPRSVAIPGLCGRRLLCACVCPPGRLQPSVNERQEY